MDNRQVFLAAIGNGQLTAITRVVALGGNRDKEEVLLGIPVPKDVEGHQVSRIGISTMAPEPGSDWMKMEIS
jgi:hypothetical protein